MSEKKQTRVIDAKDAEKPKRKAPVELILEGVDPTYMTVKKVAARYGVHVETMRRISRATYPDGTEHVQAPSKAVQQGGMLIYLYTPEDIKELDVYMAKRGYPR